MGLGGGGLGSNWWRQKLNLVEKSNITGSNSQMELQITLPCRNVKKYDKVTPTVKCLLSMHTILESLILIISMFQLIVYWNEWF